ncbi:MAG: Fur family transcriptional regulator [Oligoflexia bacterium]|nr:Fur family transcriptional regulator [Oligoflexia bacterium]
MPKKTLPCGRPAAPAAPHATSARIAEWQQKLRDYLTAQGLKYSEQRWKIAELILSIGRHLDAQGLVDRVKKEHPGIGAATVYRNIKVLCDARILKESLTDSNGRVVYELFDDDHHDHIVCLDCGEIFEFHNDQIEALQNSLVRDMKFKQVKHRHVIYVNCEYAQK